MSQIPYDYFRQNDALAEAVMKVQDVSEHDRSIEKSILKEYGAQHLLELPRELREEVLRRVEEEKTVRKEIKPGVYTSKTTGITPEDSKRAWKKGIEAGKSVAAAQKERLANHPGVKAHKAKNLEEKYDVVFGGGSEKDHMARRETISVDAKNEKEARKKGKDLFRYKPKQYPSAPWRIYNVVQRDTIKEDHADAINELKKETLKSYVKKAASDIGDREANLTHAIRDAAAEADKFREQGHDKKADFVINKADGKYYDSVKKVSQRHSGISTALKKLEEETIQELYKRTLYKYLKKNVASSKDEDSVEKSRRREAGAKMAAKKLYGKDADHDLDLLKKEVKEEEISELSTSTLKSYIGKAAGDAYNKMDRANLHSVIGHRDNDEKSLSKADKLNAKAYKRVGYIGVAATKLEEDDKLGSGERFDKLAKKVHSKKLAAWIGMKKYGKKGMENLAHKHHLEEDQIDELKASTLNDYMDKSGAEAGFIKRRLNSPNTPEDMKPEGQRRLKNRTQGINRAFTRTNDREMRVGGATGPDAFKKYKLKEENE